MEERDRILLEALDRDPQGVQESLTESDREQLAFLLGLYAEGGSEERILGISRAVSAHLAAALPSDREEAIARRLAGSPFVGDLPSARLAARYGGVRMPSADGSRATLPVGADHDPHVPEEEWPWGEDEGEDDPASREVFRAVAARLLAEPFLTPDDLEEDFGRRADHPHLIILVGDTGEPRLPAFQFDGEGRPLPVVLRVNELLGAAHDPWGVADWWLGANLWLGAAPASLLRTNANAQLLAAAGAVGEGD
ncbi:DUF3168 domain-containing protein [Streptomyces dioscori]|uniref:DUF3168 domain-containing protein n=1 Tax=Streptomyces dioscori TaxID=2109333 RepID=UPI00131BDB50|nr:DUF3168 domain-containing protein [Streptomyces dioscori]